MLAEIGAVFPATSKTVSSIKYSDCEGERTRLITRNEPLLFEQAAENWPAMRLWTFDYLRNRFANETHQCEHVVDGSRIGKDFRFDEYIDYVCETSDQNPYYLGNCQIHLNTELEEHYTAPDFANCWYKNFSTERNKYVLSWLFIGPANSWSILHIDRWNTSAWNAVIKGLKLWVFYDPSQTELLYEGKVNPFVPDPSRFPKFLQAKPLVCIQRPGDIVFTPSGWWHAVKNLEAGISITENFINETNYQGVIDFFRNHDRPNSIKTLEAMRTHSILHQTK